MRGLKVAHKADRPGRPGSLGVSPPCLADRATIDHRLRAATSPCNATGIGRPRCEPSFIPDLIDRAYAVADADSIAAARVLSRRIGRLCGGSTGCNLIACMALVREMAGIGPEQVGAVRCRCCARSRLMAVSQHLL